MRLHPRSGTGLNQIVLVVEEDLADQLLIARALAELGGKVKLVTLVTGGDALDYCLKRGPYQSRMESESPRLVIADHVLPDMRAIDLVNALQVSGKRSVPVFVYADDLNGEAHLYAQHALPAPFAKNGDVASFQSALRAAVLEHVGG